MVKRFALFLGAGAIAAAATVVGLASIAQATTGTGALDCPTLSVFNPTHYGLEVGATATCTIDNSGVADGPVDVFIKSSDLGTTTLTGTASGGTITFTYTAPANGCNTGIVAYGAAGTLANNSVISGGNSAAGFAYLSPSGTLVTCLSGSPSPSPSPSPSANPSPSPAPFGGVLAATGDNTPVQILALILLVSGLSAVIGGTLAWRRRRM